MHCFRSALLLLVLVVAQGSNSSNSSNLTTTPAPTATTTTVPTKKVSGKIVISVSQAMCDWAKNLSATNKTAILQQLVPNITQVSYITIGCASRRLLEQRNRKLTADKKLEIKFEGVVPKSTTITVTAALLTQLRALLITLGADPTQVSNLNEGSFQIVLDDTESNKASTFCMHGLLIACLGLLAGVHLV